MTVKVKICGITGVKDALSAVESGADALGFIFYGKSPRHITPEEAAGIIKRLPPFVTVAGVFVNEHVDAVKSVIKAAGLDAVQLHGEEGPEYCKALKDFAKIIKAFRIKSAEDLKAIPSYEASAFLLDAYKPGSHGGTGEVFDWDIAVSAKKFGPVILSGGLNCDNVREAVRKVRPYAIDASSGVEASPGKKDIDKLKRFIELAKGCL